MKIIIISEYASRELYVIEQVLKHFPNTVVVQPDYSTATKNDAPLTKLWKAPSFAKIVNGLGWKIHRQLWDRKLYPRKSFPDVPNTLYIPSNAVNGTKSIKIIKQLNPDIIITCRAPILHSKLFTLANIAAVNVHYGLAPYYRGNDTLFWPLYFKDYEHLGGCIHYLTEGVDTGNIVAEVYPDLSSYDAEITVDIKTTRLLAKALIMFLKAAEIGDKDLRGKAQLEKGRNFKSKDRTMKHSLSYLIKRAALLSRPPKRESRLITYF